MYELTHLVFAAYDYGRLKTTPPGEFADADADLIADAMPRLAEISIENLKVCSPPPAFLFLASPRRPRSSFPGSFPPKKQDDITAELVTSMCLMARDKAFVSRAAPEKYHRLLEGVRKAVDWLLSRQNESGSFGRYEYLRPSLGDLIDAIGYLHTCSVTVEAITTAFQPGGCCVDQNPGKPSTKQSSQKSEL